MKLSAGMCAVCKACKPGAGGDNFLLDLAHLKSRSSVKIAARYQAELKSERQIRHEKRAPE